MSKREFIKKHREEIDRYIKEKVNDISLQRLNDREREMWILNDERLYNWARSEGVKI